jgi:hypothetical protein
MPLATQCLSPCLQRGRFAEPGRNAGSICSARLFFAFRARLLCKKKRLLITFGHISPSKFQPTRTLLMAFASTNIYTDGSARGFFGARAAVPVFARNVRPTPGSPPSGDTWNPLNPSLCRESDNYLSLHLLVARHVPC